MRKVTRRKDIVIHAANKGGAIVVMNRDWYNGKMKEQVVEGYEIIGKNTRLEKERLISNIMKSNEEGHGEK